MLLFCSCPKKQYQHYVTKILKYFSNAMCSRLLVKSNFPETLLIELTPMMQFLKQVTSDVAVLHGK